MRKIGLWIGVAVVLGGWATAAWAQDDGFDWEKFRRAGQGAGAGAGGEFRRDIFTDEGVRESIRRGCEYVWKMQGGDGGWAPWTEGPGACPTGTTALAAYALMVAGVPPTDKRIISTLEYLGKTPTTKTYDLGLRCNVWYLANKDTNYKYSKPFKDDLFKLVKSTAKGGYNYNCNSDAQSDGDNSNSQYGLLGAWAGAMAQQEMPEQYWLLVLSHWKNSQKPDGGWSYNTTLESTATMTAGGIASMYVCFDQLFAEKYVKCETGSTRGAEKPIRDGLAWMDKNFASALGGGNLGYGDLHYFLYGVERVGLASGYKYFGTQDWYKLGAVKLMQSQAGDGSWTGKYQALVDTCFAILFLARGQHAIAFNKLEYGGDWNNRPRDLASLTRWLTNAMERQLNWQIVSLATPPDDWHDAPILYVAGSKDPNMTDAHIAKLRTYVQQGGTIMSVTECNGAPFSKGIRAAYAKMFPELELKKAGVQHDLYQIQHHLPGSPSYFEMHNGIRPLVIHTDNDLSKSWQLNRPKTFPLDFQAPANTLMYVTDKGKLRNRGVSHWPPRPEGAAGSGAVRMARLKYKGTWDPEPLAYERFSRLMNLEARADVEIVCPYEIEKLTKQDPNVPKVASLTGTQSFVLTPAETAALKKWITGGGTLIVDAAGGTKGFAEQAENLLAEMFGKTQIKVLQPDAPIYKLAGLEIKEVSYRRKAKVDRGLKATPNLRGVYLGKRLAVIFSKEDITGGLLGCPSYNCLGYAPESCFAIMRNAVVLGTGVKAVGPPPPKAAPAEKQ